MASVSLLAVEIASCPHLPNGSRQIKSLCHSMTVENVFHLFHPEQGDGRKGNYFNCEVNTGISTEKCPFKVEDYVQISELVSSFGIKTLKFSCIPSDPELEEAKEFVSSTTKKAVNAFELLMSKGRDLPKKKTSSAGMKTALNQKDQLFNNLVDDFCERKLEFPVGSDSSYFVQVLCNALWYVTNHHETINGESKRSSVHGIPATFGKYQHYNDSRRKKIKRENLSATDLNSHSQALYSILMKPVVKSSAAWCLMHDEIKGLADSLFSYQEFLRNKSVEVNKNHAKESPVRTVGNNATDEHRKKVLPAALKEKYKLLDAELASKEDGAHLFFNETVHVNSPLENSMQRFRFLSELQLTVPVDIYKFCPGGSIVSTVCITKVKDGRSEPELLIEGARFVMNNKKQFREYHTRTMKRTFKEKINNIVRTSPMLLDFIYKELTLDATSASHPDTQERLRLISLGETDLLADLRHCNPGRPSDKFDVFFTHLGELVEEKTAVDDRRQGASHLAEWLSLSDMIEQASKKCPENTLIPSKSLVRLQFAPRNPYAKSAWNFTSRIDVQYKIQRRQLRSSHPDEHYCNALLKYLKQRAVELKEAEGVSAAFICADDKAKVPLGEPGFAVSTGVRGKQSIAPTSTTLVAADHDMCKSSLTPSVILECSVPDSVESSFVRGHVTVTVNDSVFQTSNPFRHAASLSKVLLQQDSNLNVLIKYTDGGVDHRNTLESVKCASICLFKELNLDMLILGRCAPGHSWRNPAERIMSILNLGLQNCSLERERTDEAAEKVLKACGSMSEIRQKALREPDLRRCYTESIEPVQAQIAGRFRRLKLKEEPIQLADPVREEEIDLIKRHLRELFPDLNLEKLQKVYTSRVKSFVSWKEKHCMERQYTFQIRKCEDPACCIPSRISANHLNWIPDPVLSDDGEHYKPYKEVNGLITTEKDRPTVLIAPQTQNIHAEKGKKRKAAAPKVSEFELLNVGGVTLSAQTARSVISCVECRKPRVVYAKLKLSGRQEMQLAELFSTFNYTCGAPLTPPDHSLHGTAIVRLGMDCSSPVETPYYGASVGPIDICCVCGVEKGDVDQNLRKEFKTVLPVCQECKILGFEHPCFRPYGKKKAP